MSKAKVWLTFLLPSDSTHPMLQSEYVTHTTSLEFGMLVSIGTIVRASTPAEAFDLAHEVLLPIAKGEVPVSRGAVPCET